MSARLARAGLIAVAAGAAVLLLLREPIERAPTAAADRIETTLTASVPASAADAAEAASAVNEAIELAQAAASSPASAAAASAVAAASAPSAAASAALLAALPASAASAAASTETAGASAPGQSTAAAASSAASATVVVAAASSPASAAVGAASSPASAAVAAATPASGASAATLAANRVDPCGELIARLPNVSKALCQAAELKPSGWFSVDGFPLFQRDVIAAAQPFSERASGPRPPRRPRVLVMGAIHGDEISSASLVFHWIAHALDTGAEMDWRFIPALNPDGLLQKKPSRMNSRGVDLNRNFPTPHWHPNAHEYWTKRTKQDARRYPGPEPLSEPESRFVTQTMDGWKPDVIVSVHAPFGVLDYDGPSTPPERLGRLFLDRVGIYPGSLGNYGGVHRGVPVVTIELPSAIRTPTDTEMRQMWIDLLRWIGERLSPVER